MAGVLDPQTLKPQAASTYDLGTSALTWRTIYADTGNISNLPDTPGDRDIANTFIVASANVTGGALADIDTYWTMRAGIVGTSLVRTSPVSRGIVDLIADGGDSADLITKKTAHVGEWGSISYEAWVFFPTLDTNWRANSAGILIGLAQAGGLLTTLLSDFAAWTMVNSGKLRPQQKKEGTGTDGSDINVAVNTFHQFKVIAKPNSIDYYFNGSLQQTLTTNIVSRAVLGMTHVSRVLGAAQSDILLEYARFKVSSS